MKATDRELINLFKKHKNYSAVAKELGITITSVNRRLRRLGYVSDYSLTHGKREVKLVKGAESKGRIVSLAHGYLNDLGFKRNDELVGEWYIDDGKLILRPRKVS